jgi:hypothetical protein
VHAGGLSLSHLVPIVAGELQLGGDRHLDLGHGNEVIESGLAGDFLMQEPPHLAVGSFVCQPREQRVALARTILLQLLEPADEGVRLLWHARQHRLDTLPFGLDEIALALLEQPFVLQRGTPIWIGEARRHALAVEICQLTVEGVAFLFQRDVGVPQRYAHHAL